MTVSATRCAGRHAVAARKPPAVGKFSGVHCVAESCVSCVASRANAEPEDSPSNAVVVAARIFQRRADWLVPRTRGIWLFIALQVNPFPEGWQWKGGTGIRAPGCSRTPDVENSSPGGVTNERWGQRMEREPAGVNPHEPSSARVLDYLLGGKDNYEADRRVAERILAVAPETRMVGWFSRQFLLHAVRLAARAGVRQFVDLGAGLPTSPNVHETARGFDPDVRVVYVDNDPVAYVHSSVMLGDSVGVTALHADVRQPDGVCEQLADAGIDFAEPVAFTAVGVFHFVMDSEDPAGLVARYREAMARGSWWAMTHGSDRSDPEVIARTSSDTKNSAAQVQYRSREQVATMLTGLDLLEPGVAPIQDFLVAGLPVTHLELYGAIGHKP